MRLDMLVGGVLVVELKVTERLAAIHVAQALSYLKATDLRLALLINFDVLRLKDGGIRRVVRSAGVVRSGSSQDNRTTGHGLDEGT